MGCSGSKSDGSSPEANSPKNKDGDDSITVEEAVKYAVEELKLPQEAAEKLIETINTNDDGKLSRKECEAFAKNVKEAKEYLEPRFKEKDPDNTGTVSAADCVEILSEKFPSFTPEQITRLCKRYDADKDGKNDERVIYGHFVIFYAHMKAKKELLASMYQDLDADGSNKVSVDELTKALMKQCALDENQARSIAEDFDTSKDGIISKEEFNKVVAALV